MEHAPTRFGRQPIADLMRKKGMTVKAAAQEIGDEENHVYSAVTGRTTPNPRVRIELPVLLGIMPSQAWTEEVLKYKRVNGTLSKYEMFERYEQDRTQ